MLSIFLSLDGNWERSFLCDIDFKTFQDLGRLALPSRGKGGHPWWEQQLLGTWKGQLPELRDFALQWWVFLLFSFHSLFRFSFELIVVICWHWWLETTFKGRGPVQWDYYKATFRGSCCNFQEIFSQRRHWCRQTVLF
jgi:hypothetical protein